MGLHTEIVGIKFQNLRLNAISTPSLNGSSLAVGEGASRGGDAPG